MFFNGWEEGRNNFPVPTFTGLFLRRGAIHIDGDKQEQPHHINKMPIPRSRFETEVIVGRKMALPRPPPANGEKDRSDDDMKAVKSRRHKKGRAEHAALDAESSV